MNRRHHTLALAAAAAICMAFVGCKQEPSGGPQPPAAKSPPPAPAGPVETKLKGPAVFHKGTVSIPLRELCDWLGASMAGSPPHLTVTLGTVRAELTIGKKQVGVSDGGSTHELTLDRPPSIEGDTTYVPARFAEALGAKLAYDEQPKQPLADKYPKTLVTKGNLAFSTPDRTASLVVGDPSAAGFEPTSADTYMMFTEGATVAVDIGPNGEMSTRGTNGSTPKPCTFSQWEKVQEGGSKTKFKVNFIDGKLDEAAYPS
jgi:hypothetical protein